MKRIAVLLAAVLLLNPRAPAQESKTITIKAGNDFMEAIYKEIYRYPQFVKGKVVFKDGAISGTALNYNLLNGEIQFIDPNSDTLALANEQTVEYVTIGTDSFFYDQGYLELIESKPAVKLAMRQRLKFLDKQKIGAFGLPSAAGSIDGYNSYSDGRSLSKLSVREDIRLSKKTEFYLGDKFNHFLTVNKKNLYRMFSKHENAIDGYLKQHSLNFNNEADMKKLAGFLQALVIN